MNRVEIMFGNFDASFCMGVGYAKGEVSFDITDPEQLILVLKKMQKVGWVNVSNETQAKRAAFFLRCLPSDKQRANFLTVPGVAVGLGRYGYGEALLKTLCGMLFKTDMTEYFPAKKKIVDILSLPGVVPTLKDVSCPMGNIPKGYANGSPIYTMVRLIGNLGCSVLDRLVTNPEVRESLADDALALQKILSERVFVSSELVGFFLEFGDADRLVGEGDIRASGFSHIVEQEESAKLLVEKGYGKEVLSEARDPKAMDWTILRVLSPAIIGGMVDHGLGSDVLATIEGFGERLTFVHDAASYKVMSLQARLLAQPGVVETFVKAGWGEPVFDLIERQKKAKTRIKTYGNGSGEEKLIATYRTVRYILAAEGAVESLIKAGFEKRLKPMVKGLSEDEQLMLAEAIGNDTFVSHFGSFRPEGSGLVGRVLGHRL